MTPSAVSVSPSEGAARAVVVSPTPLDERQAQRGEPTHADVPLGRTMVLGVAGTCAVVVGALLGGLSFETHLPGAWFFGMQGGLFGSIGTDALLPTITSLVLVFGGLIVLTRVWLGFLRMLAQHRGFPVTRVVGVLAIWAIPLLLAPPLFSRDVYTYAAQGEMMSHHINPYSYGPDVLGSNPFTTLPDSVWTGTESPYGPTFLTVDGVLDQASGHHILADLALLRLLEVGGVVLMIAATPTLARSSGRDPAHAVLLGAGSPLVLLSLIGGAHNDALMVGLLMTGLAVAKRVGTVPGVILCALAAGVKSPAALGVVFLGWAWAGPGASVARRIGHTLGAGAIALATMEAVTLVSGTGWGWVRTTTAADASFTGVTPVNVLARGASILSHLLQVPVSTMGFRPVFSILGLLFAAAAGAVLLVRAPRQGVVRNLGLSLLILALLGPIVWAWYVTWGIVVLAPVAVGRLRSVLIVVSTFWAFAGMTSLHDVWFRIIHTNVVPDLFLFASLLAVLIVPFEQFASPRTGSPRLPRPRLPRPAPPIGGAGGPPRLAGAG